MPETPTIAGRAAELRADFSLFDDWEARFTYLIDLGRALPPLDPSETVEANRVRGCASQVWLVAEPSPALPGAIRFRGASDALIVSGLVALLLNLYSDRTPAEILAFDAPGFLSEIGIAEALTPQRSNGLKSVLARIHDTARAAL
jgi:cysteine desulfuration protein SufE